MFKLSKKDSENGKKINKTINSLVRKIVKKIPVRKIILFGSCARGDWHEGSDIDLIVVGDFREDFFSRINNILTLCDSDIPLEVLAYTPKEFEDMIKCRNYFIKQVLSEGKVLYG